MTCAVCLGCHCYNSCLISNIIAATEANPQNSPQSHDCAATRPLDQPPRYSPSRNCPTVLPETTSTPPSSFHTVTVSTASARAKTAMLRNCASPYIPHGEQPQHYMLLALCSVFINPLFGLAAVLSSGMFGLLGKSRVET